MLTVSVGLAPPGRRLPSAGLLAAADSALYQAKHNGRNRVALAASR